MQLCLLTIVVVAGLFGQYNCQTTTGAPTRLDPNAYCFDCLMRVNNRDLFANPIDCHTYFQCLYLNETSALGILRHCGPGAYFDESRLTCRAEGAVPCQTSPCSNPTIASIGCYQLPGQSCREYFTCASNETTRCCPMNTRFNPNTCGCVSDTTCKDFCQPSLLALPPPVSNLTACTDSFGNTLMPVDGRPDMFRLGDYNLSCALGTTFNLTACACATTVNVTVTRVTGARQCKLWLPFENDLRDKSTNEFTTFAYGFAMLDVTTAASGTGSLLVNTGRLEVPGMKTMELANPLGSTWCFSFRCLSTTSASPYGCNRNGGILSNSRDGSASVYTIISAILGTNSLLTRIRTENSTASLTTPLNTQTSGWNSVCLVYSNQTEVTMYLNGALGSTVPLVGIPAVTHCPYVVGNDQFYGSFVGNIDNVLVCDTPLTPAEVQAHYTGNTAALAAADLIPEP